MMPSSHNQSALSPAPPHNKNILITALISQQLLSALAFPIAKFGLSQIEPFTFAFFRFLISASVLLLLVNLKKFPNSIEKKDYWKLLGLGLLIIPFNQTAYLVGQRMTSAGHGAILFATVPLWMFITGMLHLKEKFVWRRGIGVAVGLTGVLIIMGGGAATFSTRYLWGDLIVLEAVLAWVYYSILGKPLVIKYGAFRVTAYSLAFGTIFYFPFGLYRALHFDYSGVSAGAWISVLYYSLGISVTAYVLWYWLLKHMEATRLAVFNNIQPVIASVVALVFFGEPIGPGLLIGGSIVLAGVLITEI
jgi:drug/metabolite transporter (DMT)-like permease